MKYLLIDFGATYIKCALHSNGVITPTVNVPSPFQHKTQVTKQELTDILEDIVSNHKDIQGIFICTILGGNWEEDIYKSWKCADPTDKGSMCMVSGVFNNTIIHTDHKDFTKAQHYTDKPLVIGRIKDVPMYSPLGDTNCVIRSLSLPPNGVAINMGTGSQIISKTEVKRFYPAGRSFLVFNRLFETSSVSLFDMIQTLTVQDVVNSSLVVDLAVFEQARSWTGGGAISGITESNFTIQNVAASIIKTFVLQYSDSLTNAESVTLVGGIASKVSILPELFQFYYPDKTIIRKESPVEATHEGMCYLINKYNL
jgi:hypothetical protein